MNDSHEIRDYLDRMAAADPYGAVDGGRLLARGQRGRRHRRMLAGGGAATGVVAVVAVTATLLSGAGNAPVPGDEASVAGVATPSARPGGAGTASSAGPTGSSSEVVSEPEALRRCREQWARDTGRQIPAVHLVSSLPISDSGPRRYRVHTSMWIDYDDEHGAYDCSIPAKGENRRGRILDAEEPKADPAMFADPSADDASVLRACSASLARRARGIPGDPVYSHLSKPIVTDLTGWQVMARSKLPRIGTVFIALSPSRDLYANCEVYPPGSAWDAGLRSTAFRASGKGKLPGPMMESGNQCDSRCKGFLVQAAGQVTPRITRIHVKATYGGEVDVPVNQGWYALLWANGDPQKRMDMTVTAYDAKGDVVRPG